VIVVSEGVAYEVVANGQPTDPIDVPPSDGPDPDEASLPSAGSGPEEPAPDVDRPGPVLPCPGSAAILVLAIIPLGRRRRKT
jgi:hypothetical protein